MLKNLVRLPEAKAELEACLVLFEGNPAGQAKVLSSLADIFDRQGDRAQAVAQERRALALSERLPDPADRALSHNNLASSLEPGGSPAALAEAARHQLAALAYQLAAGLGQHLQTSFRNYVIDYRRARAAGVVGGWARRVWNLMSLRRRGAAGAEPEIPRLAQVLADPAFAALDQWLRQRGMDPAELQAAIDEVLAQAREAAAPVGWAKRSVPILTSAEPRWARRANPRRTSRSFAVRAFAHPTVPVQ